MRLAALLCASASSLAGAQESEVYVPGEWVPLPVCVVDEVRVDEVRPGGWKRNEAWSPRELVVTHRVEGEELVLELSDGDGYSGAPLSFRLAASPDGAVQVLAAGSTYSCLGRAELFDVHGELHLARRTAASRAPLRARFRIDAIDADLRPLRTIGELVVPLAPGEWDHELCEPACPAPDGMESLREVRWCWPSGALRARGHVDASGRRHGPWESWHENGRLRSAAEFVAGEARGLFWGGDEHGRFETLGIVERGVPVGEWWDLYRDGNRVVHERTMR